MKLGTRIRQVRTDAGLTIPDVARRARISASSWGEIERGRTPWPSTLAKIARALGVPVASLEAEPEAMHYRSGSITLTQPAHCIYIIRDPGGEVLYVGETAHLLARLATHSRRYPGATAQWYEVATRADGLDHEAELIDRLDPRDNVSRPSVPRAQRAPDRDRGTRLEGRPTVTRAPLSKGHGHAVSPAPPARAIERMKKGTVPPSEQGSSRGTPEGGVPPRDHPPVGPVRAASRSTYGFPTPRRCAFCGQVFTPTRRHSARWCSDVCRSGWRTWGGPRIPFLTCRECGAIFKPNRADRELCSERCKTAGTKRRRGREKINAEQRARRARSPERRVWTDAARDAYHRRRARRRAASTGRPVLRSEIAERDEWTCHICEEVDPGLEWPDPMSASLDHVVPLAAGGIHDPENVRLAHLACNTAKGARCA